MILKRDNVERIIENETTAKAMLANGWKEVEQPKKQSKKKADNAEKESEDATD